MVEHIVLFIRKPTGTEVQIQSLSEILLKMVDEIPGIREISVGINSSPEGMNQGYNYGMIVCFQDREARNAYLPHPFYQSVVKEYVRPNVDDTLVLDYEH